MPALAEKIHRRIPFLGSAKTIRAARAYLDFLELGGEMRFDELTPALLKGILDRDHPVLAGLSATYLYRWTRERQLDELDELVPDDIRGEPTGTSSSSRATSSGGGASRCATPRCTCRRRAATGGRWWTRRA